MTLWSLPCYISCDINSWLLNIFSRKETSSHLVTFHLSSLVSRLWFHQHCWLALALINSRVEKQRGIESAPELMIGSSGARAPSCLKLHRDLCVSRALGWNCCARDGKQRNFWLGRRKHCSSLRKIENLHLYPSCKKPSCRSILPLNEETKFPESLASAVIMLWLLFVCLHCICHVFCSVMHLHINVSEVLVMILPFPAQCACWGFYMHAQMLLVFPVTTDPLVTLPMLLE